MDEATTYLQTRADSMLSVYSAVMTQEGHIGPLYHVLNYLLCQLFGYSEWGLRLPSAIYGTVAVILVYKIAETLTNNHVALLSSILMAISPVLVWYSQEARMYSLWVMLILITTFLFIRVLEQRQLWLWVLFTIFASLSVWTLLNSVFILLSLGLYLVIFFKMYKREFCFYIVSMFVAAASYFPGIIALLAKGPVSVGSSRTTTVFDFIYAFYVFNVGTTLGPSLLGIRMSLKHLGSVNTAWEIVSQHGVLLMPSLLLYGSIFLYGTYKAVTTRKDDNNIFVLVMLFVPLVMVFGITLFSSSLPFNVRYILCVLPFYLIFLSAALNELSTRKRWILLSGMIFLSVFSLFNHYFKAEYAKLDFRSVVKYLNETMTDSDNAIIIHEGANSILRYYDKTDKFIGYCIPPYNSLKSASSIINEGKRIFYVKSVRIQEYNDTEINKIESLLATDFKLTDSTNQAPGIEVRIYERQGN